MARPAKKTVRFTEDEWESLLPLLKGLSDNTRLWGHRVLVDWIEPTSVAKEAGISNQAVHQAVKRILARIGAVESSLTPVVCWMPDNKINELRENVLKLGGRFNNTQCKS